MPQQLAWTWFAEDSHVKTSASRAPAAVSPLRALDSGGSFGESSASCDQSTSSLKTSTAAGVAGCPSCGAAFGKSGMPACRFECPPLKLALPTVARDVFFLPTPMASSSGYQRGGAAGRTGPVRLSLGTMARRGLLPTPTSSLGTHGGLITSEKARDGGNLIEAMSTLVRRGLLATPTLRGNYNRAGASESSGDGLATQMGGRLNPRFLEWMMGLPDGWTASASAETEPSPSKSPSPGER